MKLSLKEYFWLKEGVRRTLSAELPSEDRAYLTELDAKLQKQISKVPQGFLLDGSKGFGSRIFMIYKDQVYAELQRLVYTQTHEMNRVAVLAPDSTAVTVIVEEIKSWMQPMIAKSKALPFPYIEFRNGVRVSFNTVRNAKAFRGHTFDTAYVLDNGND
jgi:hypothetical protein